MVGYCLYGHLNNLYMSFFYMMNNASKLPLPGSADCTQPRLVWGQFVLVVDLIFKASIVLHATWLNWKCINILTFKVSRFGFVCHMS